MDTKKLATFADLAQTNNFGETAERLFSTQATVSKHILALEKDWQVQLFSREHRKVSLTEAGKAVLPDVLDVLAAEKHLNQTLQRQQKQHSESLIIKAIPSISQYRAFYVITEFAKQHPEIDLKFNEAETDTLFDQLNDGSADIIFTRLFDDRLPRFDVISDEQDYFMALIPKGHPLADQTHLMVDMLRGESFLLLDDSTELLKPIVSLLNKAGIEPNITYEGRRIDLILGMLNQGMGLSIMMNNSFDLSDYDNVVALPIYPKKYSRLAFVRRLSQPSVASDLFWEFARKSE